MKAMRYWLGLLGDRSARSMSDKNDVGKKKKDVGVEALRSACGGPQTQGYLGLNAEDCKTCPYDII